MTAAASQALAAIKLEASGTGTATFELARMQVETSVSFSSNNQMLARMQAETSLGVVVTQRVARMMVETHLVGTDTPPPPEPPVSPQFPVPNTFRPLDIPCIPAPRSRFRRFWATQPNVCPAEAGQCTYADPNNLATECQQPGLQLLITTDPDYEQLRCAYDGKGGLPEDGCAPPITGATINTENYVRGLVINILGTNAAQAPSICGNRPGQRLGYWLDSISGDKSGSSIRYVPTNGFNTAQCVQFIQFQAQADLQKLITYGVANSVTATASYAGNGTIALNIVVEGVDDTTIVVNSTMTKISNAWVWNAP